MPHVHLTVRYISDPQREKLSEPQPRVEGSTREPTEFRWHRIQDPLRFRDTQESCPRAIDVSKRPNATPGLIQGHFASRVGMIEGCAQHGPIAVRSRLRAAHRLAIFARLNQTIAPLEELSRRQRGDLLLA